MKQISNRGEFHVCSQVLICHAAAYVWLGGLSWSNELRRINPIKTVKVSNAQLKPEAGLLTTASSVPNVNNGQ